MNTDETQLTKDICYLYHIQSEYKGLMPDISWSDEFALPYWQHLKAFSDSDDSFHKNGCMVFLLLLALDKIDGSGDGMKSIHRQCMAAADAVIPHTKTEDVLKELLINVLKKSNSKTSLSKEDEEGISWVYSEVIEAYFKDTLK